jgi:hypothetical protein
VPPGVANGRLLSPWWDGLCDHVGFRVVRAVEEQPELRGLRSREGL